MALPWVSFGSDAGALAAAIRKLTLLPATNLGIRDRGRLAAGMYADIAVFDPARVADHATYAEPHQYATGVVHVLVNGEAVLANGGHTGALPGRLVRGPGWREPAALAAGRWARNVAEFHDRFIARVVAHDASKITVRRGGNRPPY